MSFDVCIVGGGVNGLAAAATLAGAGRKVCLFEAKAQLGGLAAAEELAPGFTTGGERLDAAVPEALLSGLDLERHGLAWRDAPALFVADGARGASTSASSIENGGCFVHAAAEPMREELPVAEAAYADWRATLDRWRPPLAALLAARPPDLGTRAIGELFALLRGALGLRRLGERDMHELMRVAPMAVHDWLGETLRDERLCAAIAVRALAGTTLGPRAPGTAAALLLDEALRGREPVGGAPALAASLSACARARGAELRTGARVEEIRVSGERVRGVRVAGGDVVESKSVISTADFATTVLALLDPGALPDRLAAAASAWKRRATVAVVHVAVRGPLDFAGAGGRPVERASSATSLRVLERAADGPKHGRMADEPWAELRVRRAEAQNAVITMHLHGIPGNTPAQARAAVEERALALLERLAPGARDSACAVRTRLPRDLEAEHGLAGGHLFHGEHILDQLWVQRPALFCSRYTTPIAGLLLGGGSSHPGGALPGGSGVLAARTLLAE